MAETLSDAATKALRAFEDSKTHHDEFVSRVDENLKAYHAVLEPDDRAADWRTRINLHPPFVRHLVETTVSALLDDRLVFQVKPRPKLFEPGERETVARGAKAHEILHRYQLARDRFAEKQRPLVLQASIAGMCPVKNYWRTEERPRKRLETVDVGAEAGMPGVLFDLQETESVERVFDGPTTEILNVYDFGWHEAAVDIQRSPVVWHRVWMHYNELKLLEKQGVYKNVDKLKESRSFTNDLDDREIKNDNRSRTKDMVEVLEIWRLEEDGIRVVTLGNRKVELRADRKNPFYHGEYPFVVASMNPDLFKVQGISQVGKIKHLQDALWDLMNQRHANLQLLNNNVYAIRSDVEDPDSFEFEPGARWLVEDVQQVQQLPIDPTPSQISLPAESMIQQMMQNLAGSQPFTSTSEASRIGADTATEAALVTNLAQMATKVMKQQLYYAYERIGQQRTELNQQFLRRPVMVEQIGLDEASEFVEIAPQLLSGEWDFSLQPMAESLMRNERRAEANALFQVFLQAVPVFAALAQAGAATPLNADAFLRQWLEHYEIDDVDRFFSENVPQQVPGGPGEGAPQGPQGAPQQGNGAGITATTAAGPLSPSNADTQSPEAAMSQLMRMSGRNA